MTEAPNGVTILKWWGVSRQAHSHFEPLTAMRAVATNHGPLTNGLAVLLQARLEIPEGVRMSRKIYLASSWRNQEQPDLISALRSCGHEVYDFRNPAPGNGGFKWSEIDPEWLNWNSESYVRLVKKHPVAAAGFALDKAALDWCDTCVLLLPCGRSAHLEAGYVAGQGKSVATLLREDKFEPELMYLLGDPDGIVCSIHELMSFLSRPL